MRFFQINYTGRSKRKSWGIWYRRGRIRFSLRWQVRSIIFLMGDTKHKIGDVKNDFFVPSQESSIFIPAKEVLSLFNIILKSRDQDSMFGFDDTYLDLVKALQNPSRKGNNFKAFSQGKRSLEGLLHGHIEYDDKRREWYYKRGNSRFPIGTTSEGIKKVSIFSCLLSNRYLNNNSIIFIDEIESALHPTALIDYLDMIYELSESGGPVFHRYSLLLCDQEVVFTG